VVVGSVEAVVPVEDVGPAVVLGRVVVEVEVVSPMQGGHVPVFISERLRTNFTTPKISSLKKAQNPQPMHKFDVSQYSRPTTQSVEFSQPGLRVVMTGVVRGTPVVCVPG
jgi:hypothetical protein